MTTDDLPEAVVASFVAAGILHVAEDGTVWRLRSIWRYTVAGGATMAIGSHRTASTWREPVNQGEQTMRSDAQTPSAFGGMDELKRKWLKSWGLRPDKSVIDCDPTAQQVQLDDGSIHQLCQVYQRVMGYFQPVNMWNIGKQAEHRERLCFAEPRMQALGEHPTVPGA